MLSLVKLLLGLLAVAALGALAMTVEALPGSAVSAEARLQETVDASLASSGIDWAATDVNGQKVSVTGEAPSQDARNVALNAVSQSAGAGGLLFGGVTIIDDSGLKTVALPPIADPFLWIAERQGASLSFSGYAPSEQDKAELLSYARLQFPETDIVETLEIARGAPFETSWLQAASLSLDALARLTNGAVEANGAQFTLSGETDQSSVSRNAALLMSALPEGFSGYAEIRLTSDTVSVVEQPLPVSTPEIDETDTCRAQLSEIISTQEIGFASARRQLEDQSRIDLIPLADALAACPEFHLEIIGHTDSTGGAAENLRLSENRAAAVADYLASFDIAPGRLDAKGVGSAQPLFSNDTPEGRAGNRRIELIIFVQTDATTE